MRKSIYLYFQILTKQFQRCPETRMNTGGTYWVRTSDLYVVDVARVSLFFIGKTGILKQVCKPFCKRLWAFIWALLPKPV